MEVRNLLTEEKKKINSPKLTQNERKSEETNKQTKSTTLENPQT